MLKMLSNWYLKKNHYSQFSIIFSIIKNITKQLSKINEVCYKLVTSKVNRYKLQNFSKYQQ